MGKSVQQITSYLLSLLPTKRWIIYIIYIWELSGNPSHASLRCRSGLCLNHIMDTLTGFGTQAPTCNQLGSVAVLLEEVPDNEVVFGVVVRINKQSL